MNGIEKLYKTTDGQTFLNLDQAERHQVDIIREKYLSNFLDEILPKYFKDKSDMSELKNELIFKMNAIRSILMREDTCLRI